MNRLDGRAVPVDVGKEHRRAVDGATLACLYLLTLLAIPARLVVALVPITLPPVLVVALGIGALYLGAQLVDTLGMGKGPNVVRAAVCVLLVAHLMTYAVATRRFLPADELNLADSGMIRVVAMVAVAAFVCDAISRADRLERVVRVLVGCATFVAAVGLVQFAVGIDPVSYLSLPGLRVQDAVYASIEQRSIFRRPTGTTNHPIEFGLVCAVAVALATHVALRARMLGQPALRWWLCLGVTGAGAVLSLSRTAIIGLAVIAVVLAVFLPGRQKIVVLVTGAVVFVAGGSLVPGLLGTVYGLFANIGEDSSVTARTNDYADAFAEIAAHPWLGRGFGTFVPPHHRILDNQYLLTMVENGYVGLAALVGLFLAACWAAGRSRFLTDDPSTRSLAAALLASVLVCAVGAATFDLLSFGVACGLVFVVVGLCGGLLRGVRRRIG